MPSPLLLNIAGSFVDGPLNGEAAEEVLVPALCKNLYTPLDTDAHTLNLGCRITKCNSSHENLEDYFLP